MLPKQQNKDNCQCSLVHIKNFDLGIKVSVPALSCESSFDVTKESCIALYDLRLVSIRLSN